MEIDASELFRVYPMLLKQEDKVVQPQETPKEQLNDDAIALVNQTGFTGEHKAWKVSHDQRKFRKPFFDRSAGARSAFGA